MNFGCEDFCQRGKKKRRFVLTPKKKYNPLSEQVDMKMLTLNDFAEGLRDVCPESILFSAVPKPDVDFVTGVVKQETALLKFLKIFAVFTIGLVNQLMLRILLQIYFSTCQKKKYQKLNY